MLILSSLSIYSQIVPSCSFVRAFLVDARVLFDALPFRCLYNQQIRTSYALAAYLRFVYQPSWIASQASLIFASIVANELKIILWSNCALKVDDKYRKIRRWELVSTQREQVCSTIKFWMQWTWSGRVTPQEFHGKGVRNWGRDILNSSIT